jgi:hypothetical protein
MSAGLGDQRLLERASFRYVSWIRGPETVRESITKVCQLD